MELPARALAIVLTLAMIALPVDGARTPCAPEDCPQIGLAPIVDRVSNDVRVDRFDLDIDVHEAMAITTIEMDLVNPLDTQTTATYQLPLPQTALLRSLSFSDGGKTYAARVTEIGQFPRGETHNDKWRVPSFHFESNLVAVNFTFQPKETWTVKASYTELVQLSAGHRIYRFDFSGLGAGPVKSVSTDLEINTIHGVDELRFDGLNMILRDRESVAAAANAKLAEARFIPPLTAIWKEGPGDLLVSTLCTSAPGKTSAVQGIVFMSARPLEEAKFLDRDIVFVIDTSGSMHGEKIAAAKEGLVTGLQNLRDMDRYNIVTFDSVEQSFRGELVPGTPQNTIRDVSSVKALQAGGGTNLDGGLQKALEHLDREGNGRVPQIFLLTDGFPSAGVTEPEKILQRYHDANTRGSLVYVVSIGLAAENSFLRDLADQSGGSLVELHHGHDLSAAIRAAIEQMGTLVLSATTVAVTGLNEASIEPRPVGALYEDTTLTLSYRDVWDDGEDLVIQVEGRRPTDEISQTVTFDQNDCPIVTAVTPLISQIHLDALYAEDRSEGPDEARDRSIQTIGIRDRIVTPFTEWVIVEPATFYGDKVLRISSTQPIVPASDNTTTNNTTPPTSTQEAPFAPTFMVVGGLLVAALVTRRF